MWVIVWKRKVRLSSLWWKDYKPTTLKKNPKINALKKRIWHWNEWCKDWRVGGSDEIHA